MVRDSSGAQCGAPKYSNNPFCNGDPRNPKTPGPKPPI